MHIRGAMFIFSLQMNKIYALHKSTRPSIFYGYTCTWVFAVFSGRGFFLLSFFFFAVDLYFPYISIFTHKNCIGTRRHIGNWQVVPLLTLKLLIIGQAGGKYPLEKQFWLAVIPELVFCNHVP